jgi:DnaK suppressor protein
MKTQTYKTQLIAKAKELGRSGTSKEDIAIERQPDMLDEIQRTTEREIALDSISRNWETAAQVNAALGRIADGSYGICAACEEEISERRLSAIPWARLCIRCQEQADRDPNQARHLDLSEAA